MKRNDLSRLLFAVGWIETNQSRCLPARFCVDQCQIDLPRRNTVQLELLAVERITVRRLEFQQVTILALSDPAEKQLEKRRILRIHG